MRRKLIISLAILGLGTISVIMLTSIAPHEALGQGGYVICGLVLFGVLQYPLPKLYLKLIPYASALTLLLLYVTLLIGRMSHGAQRWLPVGPVHIQVSEFGKPILAIFLAWFASRFPLNSQVRLAVFFAISLLFFLPVFLQPDLGSSLVFLSICAVVVFFAVKKLSMLIPWIVLAFFGALLTWNFALYPYQRNRLITFLDGGGNSSYNADQAYITVGSGKLFGRGLGHGVQSQLRFLPEFHTDFFFASLAEELGAAAIYGVLAIYLVLFWQLLSLPKSANRLSRLATVGFTASVFFQMWVHMAMNMKLFPITGIPLPLLSSGGSSFLATCLGTGVLIRISDERHSPFLKKLT